MATRLLSARKRVVAYLPNLAAVVRHFNAFAISDAAPLTAITSKSFDLSTTASTGQKFTRNSSVELFKQDWQFPLPGNIGFASNLPLSSSVEFTIDSNLSEPSSQTAVSAEPLPVESLECVAQELPIVLRKDFQDLFPDRQLDSDNLTVITLSQRTQNDMTSWSDEVANEREVLLESFISGASDICQALKHSGYWADFIDPESGRPYFGAYTNSTLFETDERYRKFGFDINDVGCCKVISHQLWGSHAYVGSIFTNAPMDHPAINNFTSRK